MFWKWAGDILSLYCIICAGEGIMQKFFEGGDCCNGSSCPRRGHGWSPDLLNRRATTHCIYILRPSSVPYFAQTSGHGFGRHTLVPSPVQWLWKGDFIEKSLDQNFLSPSLPSPLQGAYLSSIQLETWGRVRFQRFKYGSRCTFKNQLILNSAWPLKNSNPFLQMRK